MPSERGCADLLLVIQFRENNRTIMYLVNEAANMRCLEEKEIFCSVLSSGFETSKSRGCMEAWSTTTPASVETVFQK